MIDEWPRKMFGFMRGWGANSMLIVSNVHILASFVVAITLAPPLPSVPMPL